MSEVNSVSTRAGKLAEWILETSGPTGPAARELTSAAARMWPHALAYTHRELFSDSPTGEDGPSLAFELWERVIRSVLRIHRRTAGTEKAIKDLDNYLMVAFIHRLNRFLKRRRQHREVVQFVPFEELDVLGKGNSINVSREWTASIESRIDLERLLGRMDDFTRQVCRAKLCKFSWKEIGTLTGMTEQRAAMRFQYAIKKLRLSLGKKE